MLLVVMEFDLVLAGLLYLNVLLLQVVVWDSMEEFLLHVHVYLVSK
jgi:hypothetical protein